MVCFHGMRRGLGLEQGRGVMQTEQILGFSNYFENNI